MRLFLGIELPQEIKTKISKMTGIMGSHAGWVHPHDLHLTLLFIGESSRMDLHEIIQRFEKIRQKKFFIQVTGPDFFRRRILFMKIQPCLELKELKKKIDTEFYLWRDLQSREFVPHITIKRWQRHEFEDLKKLVQSFQWYPESFEVKYLTLFESRLDNHQRYHPIYRLKLQDDDTQQIYHN